MSRKTYPFNPDWTVHPFEHLREFIEQWQKDPAAALACACTGVINRERAQELIDGTGRDWTSIEAAMVGMALGPNSTFWLNLYRNYRAAKAKGLKVTYRLVEEHSDD